jgi:hypothetical protein
MKKIIFAFSFLFLAACGGSDDPYTFSRSGLDEVSYESRNAYGETVTAKIYRAVSKTDVTPVSVYDKTGANYIRLYVPRRMKGKSITVTKTATCGCPGQREVVQMKHNWKDSWESNYFEAEFSKPLVQSKDYKFVFKIGDETHVLDFK